MNLSAFREKTFAFLAPILVVWGVLGGIVALLGKAYFWDVSDLTIQIPGEKEVTVVLQIQARIIYFDADLFGFYYPVHITLPWTRTQQCTSQCEFGRIPPGDAQLTVFGDNGPQRINILITPDTDGALDLRPSFSFIPVTDAQVWDSFQAPLLTPEEQKLLSNIVYSDRFLWLFLHHESGQFFLYDTTNKQSIITPLSAPPTIIVRWQNVWEYIFWTKAGITKWDRYGRIPLENVTDVALGDFVLRWSEGQTIIVHALDKQSLTGSWLPIFGAQDTLITDGEKILKIR